jgi:hypothetical protein
MNSYYTFLALDMANERARDAARRRRFLVTDELPAQNAGLARRSLARFAAALSRQSASVARRLDESIDAEDLDCECLPA